MPKTIRFNGSERGWDELSVTGKPSVWQPGQQEERSDSEAALLIATGLFSQVFTGSLAEIGAEVEGIVARVSPMIYNQQALRPVISAIGDVAAARIEITAIGHSIVFGKGAANNNIETDDEAKDASWPGRLRAQFKRWSGSDPGEGWLLMSDNRMTNSGTTSAISTTVIGKGRRLQSGQSLSFALPACTALDIMIWKDSATSTGVPTYNIDGAGDVTPSQPTAGNDYHAIISVTGLADTAHTVVLKGPGSGSAYVAAIRGRTLTPGVAVNRFGVPGAVLADLAGVGNNAENRDRVQRATIKGTGSKLLIIECDTNDEGAGTTAEAWKASAQEWVTVAAANSCAVLLLGDPRKNGANAALEDAYSVAAVELAQANAHVAHLRIADFWGSYTQGNAIGLYNGGSSVHPGRRGHGDIANILFQVLTGAVPSGVYAP
jgi:hypothetical protein